MTVLPLDIGFAPGQIIRRKDLQDQLGGRRQGGIAPSLVAPVVLLFTDEESGPRHGYFDGWMPDGCYHYTGEGQIGDQLMRQGNKSVLRHREEGRRLLLFKAAPGAGSGMVEYIGEFQVHLDPEEAVYQTDAPETGGQAVRRVFVFRLVPVDVPPGPVTSPLADALGPAAGGSPRSPAPVVEDVPVEEHATEKYFVNPAAAPREAERQEGALVQEFLRAMLQRGHRFRRLKIVPPGEHKPLFSDLWDPAAKILIEAKGSVTREVFRMAIGQLKDYGRFVPDAQLAILVPTTPRPDLVTLAHHEDITVVWPAGGSRYVASRQALDGWL